jgi:hypothetical protein
LSGFALKPGFLLLKLTAKQSTLPQKSTLQTEVGQSPTFSSLEMRKTTHFFDK